MSEFDKYKGLFAEKGDFDIPATWTVGVAVKPNEKLTIAFDVQQIHYSSINSIANPFKVEEIFPMVPDGSGGYISNPNFVPLGSDNGAGFGWEDMTIFKLGFNYKVRDDLCARAGFSHGNQPIPESEMNFNILAPGVIENHISFGLTKRLENGKAISCAVTHALSNSVKGIDAVTQAMMQINQNIELTMNQWEVEFGYSF